MRGLRGGIRKNPVQGKEKKRWGVDGFGSPPIMRGLSQRKPKGPKRKVVETGNRVLTNESKPARM
ncbi:hypothetical protein GCM10023307_06960 [Lysobacter hankyongensis]|uniref:Uncharacterized protein n=1 Tax=Lysobacter hankyongensis TaxID=1176535 RepID=A0ABP9ATQ7_9GAMM